MVDEWARVSLAEFGKHRPMILISACNFRKAVLNLAVVRSVSALAAKSTIGPIQRQAWLAFRDRKVRQPLPTVPRKPPMNSIAPFDVTLRIEPNSKEFGNAGKRYLDRVRVRPGNPSMMSHPTPLQESGRKSLNHIRNILLFKALQAF